MVEHKAETTTTTFTTPSDLEIVATRVFNAPRTLVWEATTRPEHVKQWMHGWEGYTMPVCEIDLRPGGKWHFVWNGPDDFTMEMTGVYMEVVPPERLVNTECWGGEWPESLVTTTLTEDEQGRTTLVCTARYPSKEARDAAMATGMTEGWSLSYDRMEKYMATIA